MLKRDGEEVGLNHAKRHGRIPGVLHDLLAPAVFLGQPAQLRNHSREQLHHDGRADVRHDAEREDCAVFQRAATEQIEEGRDVAAGFLRQRGAEPFLDDGLVDARGGDRRAQTHDHDDCERKQNPPAQLWYFDRI